MKLGVLISPSVDGEFGAIDRAPPGRRGDPRIIDSHRARARCATIYQALVHEGVSPVIAPDGPRGPPWKFKPGALLLAQLSQRPNHSLELLRLSRLDDQLGPIRHSEIRARGS